ncbi:hypothetical protein [Allorhizocola rhizosphaerae]|uniref:hypothetical protein n=1 Tax=Allorhizocola rhizosphaerae TaxID=1872709 RepID=UPI000E3E6BB7|nr:hypothetical protein [Allorhizocola rhizosphaerae]
MTSATWEPRRLIAVRPELPDGITPPGIRGRILRVASWFGPDQTYIREQAADAYCEFALRMVRV